MDPRFEAQQIRALGQIIRNGHFYKGAKPVHWCLDCRSALAEAEVEYEDKTSPAVDVEFRVVDHGGFRAARRRRTSTRIGAYPVSLVDLDHHALDAAGQRGGGARARTSNTCCSGCRAIGSPSCWCLPTSCWMPASRATASARARCWRSSTAPQLEHLQLQHPFLPKHVPVIVGDHVTLEAGTGAVHTAPAHGQDDFVDRPEIQPAGRQPGDGRRPLPRRHAVRRRHEGGRGQRGAHQGARDAAAACSSTRPIKHSYPHCWRHKTPVIFRATPQWFISMDQKGLRANALRDIKKVQWMPGWGEQRIFNMIEDRPDWCLSRQRTWGVPIALFVHKQTQELHPRTQELHRGGRQARREGRHRAWFDLDAARVVRRRRRHLREGHRRHGRLGRFGPVARVRAPHASRTTSSRRWICTWKARTSIAAGSIPRC